MDVGCRQTAPGNEEAELAGGPSLGCRGREESEVEQSVCPLHTGHAVTEVRSKVLEIHI